MREIKFRAWHEVNEDFIYFDLQDLLVNGYHNAQIDISQNGDINLEYKTKEYLSKRDNWFKMNCKPEQYTGLKDKNGKEIYEGDIVNTPVGDSFIVRWDNACALFSTDLYTEEEWPEMLGDWQWLEIIGNIHE